MTIIDRLHPARVTIKERSELTQKGSSKSTFHISLNLNDVPIQFQVGDSIGIYPQNDPSLVEHLISAMKKDPQEIVKDPRTQIEMTLWEFLSFKANLARITSSFLKLFYEYAPNHDKKNQLHNLLSQDRSQLTAYLATHDPLALFKEYENIQAPLSDLCAQFGPLLPRFYSAASSPLVHDKEVHLTVALTTFTHQGQKRYGACSHFLCHLASLDSTPVPIYVQKAPHFTLPADHRIPIIMIGPGTGIAPFRGFLQERLSTNALGKQWLFFGERNRQTDYLYEKELEDWHKTGKIKLDLAFSRDQSEKIYVQHQMLNQGKHLWSWLEEGAYFYVSGDAQNMAKDVEAALEQIAQEHGALSKESAKAYIKHLRSQKRYLADVY